MTYKQGESAVLQSVEIACIYMDANLISKGYKEK